MASKTATEKTTSSNKHGFQITNEHRKNKRFKLRIAYFFMAIE